ncbi:HDOD domain-containing protein [Paraneptunicella aestuarii]|uniref:HDOD domain-containing protein n=1 Tax=Paraneptunicella aestuarii TaxID=2831148 RepID=UPI001E5A6CEA|nr:HDOD domain-containing protein [Paraneptunicella aestuarii]UAA38029.1 HDOD domain-containing protein [Paraneptunicella aestuarii]
MSTENTLLTILVEKINNDTLVLPTLPAIALKVRKTAENPTVSLSKMAEVIALDPSLSARIIKLANSAYLGRSIRAESLQQAVTRIGLTQIKNIATALAMEQLFVSKNEVVKTYLNQVWDRSVKVVANSLAVFQAYSERHQVKGLNIDVMTLAALMHNIGVLPILTEAERHNEFADPKFLNQAIQKLAGRIGGAITREWGFGDEFVQVAESWRDMKVQSDKVSYLDFVRMGAVAAGFIESKKNSVINVCMQKRVIEDMDMFQSNEYKDRLATVRDIFI